MEEKIHHLEQGVLSGDREAVRTACRQLLEAGMPPQKIVRFGLLPCMDTLGQQLSRREKFIPQIMMSARAVQDGIDLLSPLIVGPDVLSLSETVVLGTVSGDIHTIGKTLVSIMLRSAGFHVVDLGTNVPPEKFVAAGAGEQLPHHRDLGNAHHDGHRHEENDPRSPRGGGKRSVAHHCRRRAGQRPVCPRAQCGICC